MAPPRKEDETTITSYHHQLPSGLEPLLSPKRRESNRWTSASPKIITLVVFVTTAVITIVPLLLMWKPFSTDHHYYHHQKTTTTTIHRLLRQLDADIEGQVYFPDTPHFADAAHVWREDVGPPLVVIEPWNEEDVTKAILVLGHLSTRFGFPFRIKSGGHSKAGYSTVKGGAILSLVRMNHVELISENGTNAIARIQAGAKTEKVLDTLLLPHGYGGSVGICGSVAEGGFVLGGGVGFISRLLGLGLDQVHEMRVVLADGGVVVAKKNDYATLKVGVPDEASNNHNNNSSSTSNNTAQVVVTPSDLFWALRGAGSGNFGVVTEMKLQFYAIQNNQTFFRSCIPINDELCKFLYELGHANFRGEFGAVCGGRDGDDTWFCYFSYFGFGPSPVEDGRAFLETEIGPMLPNGTPPMNITEYNWSEGAHQIGDYGYGKEVWAAQCWGGFLFADNNTAEVWAEIGPILATGMKESPNVNPHIELWGGAIADVDVDATAFPYREAVYNLGILLVILEPSGEDAEKSFRDQVEKVNAWWPRVAKYLTGVYLNYPMSSLVQDEYPRAYWGQHLERLVDIKRQVDPNNIFAYEQSMPLSVPNLEK